MNIPKEIALKGNDSVLNYIKFIETLEQIEKDKNELVKEIQNTQIDITNLLRENSNNLSLRMLGLNYFGSKRERFHYHAMKLQELSNYYLELTLRFSAMETKLMELYKESQTNGTLVGIHYVHYSKCSFT